MDLKEHHKYLISFAWVTPQEREKFILFPEVITVDTVFGTNYENGPLLMMGGKDSNGKIFIFLVLIYPMRRVGCFDGYLVMSLFKCKV